LLIGALLVGCCFACWLLLSLFIHIVLVITLL
jgi:hypothetical protein